MKLLARLNRPWLHFIVLGGLLFYLHGILFPEPKPVIGPLSPARVEALRQQWVAGTGRLPTQQQLDRMINAELDRDMLFQRALELNLHLYDTVVYQRLLRNMSFLQLGEGMSEQEQYQQALEMRLHLGDEVIKRRMIQVMEQLLLSVDPPAAPTDAEIQAEFEARREELRLPPKYSISHVYFNAEREAQADEAVAAIDAQGLDPEAALEYSSPFLPGYHFAHQSPAQLARHFGSAFVAKLEEAQPQPGTWVGPVRSTYGLHYVWVEAIEPGRDATLDEVRGRLLRDIESRKTAEALQRGIDAMRDDYEVRK